MTEHDQAMLEAYWAERDARRLAEAEALDLAYAEAEAFDAARAEPCLKINCHACGARNSEDAETCWNCFEAVRVEHHPDCPANDGFGCHCDELCEEPEDWDEIAGDRR
jgi:ribosomal protein L40E